MVYMKNIIVVFLLASCCFGKKIAKVNCVANDNSRYEVSRIDSINNYYLIYLKRNDTLFKIVSKKEILSNCLKIEPKHCYQLELISIWNQPIIINGTNVSPSLTPHVECIGLDDKTNVCLERNAGINDIYYAKNITGLCIVKTN